GCSDAEASRAAAPSRRPGPPSAARSARRRASRGSRTTCSRRSRGAAARDTAEVLVAPDRRIDAHRAIEMRRLQELAVELVAHAVEPLELEAVARADVHQPRDGMRIVRCELRIEMRALVQQRARARKVRDVGARLAREDRVAGEALLLRALDLGVPVRPLDETHRDHAMPAVPELL